MTCLQNFSTNQHITTKTNDNNKKQVAKNKPEATCHMARFALLLVVRVSIAPYYPKICSFPYTPSHHSENPVP